MRLVHINSFNCSFLAKYFLFQNDINTGLFINIMYYIIYTYRISLIAPSTMLLSTIQFWYHTSHVYLLLLNRLHVLLIASSAMLSVTT